MNPSAGIAARVLVMPNIPANGAWKTKSHSYTLLLFSVLLSAQVTAGLPQPRAEASLVSHDASSPLGRYSLPSHSRNQALRAAQIEHKQAVFLYGPGIGGGPYSPSGPLGDELVKQDLAISVALADQQRRIVDAEVALSSKSSSQV